MGEIEEESPASAVTDECTPLVSDNSSQLSPKKSRSVRTDVPEVEVHLYKEGKGPIDVFKSGLSGWDQNQLEVGDILVKYGFNSVYAFTPGEGRGAPIRFHPRNGRSLLPYKDGSVICIDGKPKDSLIKPVTKIILGVVVTTVLIIIAVKEINLEWAKKFPPWVLACAVIVFTRIGKRTRNFLEKRGS